MTVTDDRTHTARRGRLTPECKRAALALPLYLFLAELQTCMNDSRRTLAARAEARALHDRIAAEGPAQVSPWA